MVGICLSISKRDSPRTGGWQARLPRTSASETDLRREVPHTARNKFKVHVYQSISKSISKKVCSNQQLNSGQNNYCPRAKPYFGTVICRAPETKTLFPWVSNNRKYWSLYPCPKHQRIFAATSRACRNC